MRKRGASTTAARRARTTKSREGGTNLGALLAAAHVEGRSIPLFSPPNGDPSALAALRIDLAEVPVRGPDGAVTDLYEKFMAEPLLRHSQRHRILRVLAEVRECFLRQDAALAPEAPGKGYQIVNWKHTRAEVDQVLEAAKLARLPSHALEDALLGSIFSDAVKAPGNFIVHNLDGAAAALHVLARYFDPRAAGNARRLLAIAAVVKEHQISPPRFMATVVENMIRRRREGRGEDCAGALRSLCDKIARPFAAPLDLVDGATIAFSAAEHELLAIIDVTAWWVPHSSTSWYGASRAVIDGDCLINYACPEGWAKIVALRGPETQPDFEDATVFDSLRSAKESWDDALSVMTEAARPLAEAGLSRTEAAIGRMRERLRAWIAAQPDRPALPDGAVPFWDAPLVYPRQHSLDARGEAQFRFAKRIRDEVVRFLREEQGRY